MKNILSFLTFFFLLAFTSKAQTSHLKKTSQQFQNGEFVYELQNANDEKVGEFWPVHALNLVTKTTDPNVFTNPSEILSTMGSVATAPDGMTTGSYGSYKMEGRSLANGKPCGDGTVYNYGIVVVDKGHKISFTHKLEVGDSFDSLYEDTKNAGGTMFFLPSIYRNGSRLHSNKVVDKVLVRRETYAGVQIGVVQFTHLVTYDDAAGIILGLDRSGASSTTHIYVLDGGPNWGQSTKIVNSATITVGTCNPAYLSNELVFY